MRSVKEETLQLPVCPLCKGKRSNEQFTERDYQLLSCQVCTLFFIHPYPVDLGVVHASVSTYSFDHLRIQSPESHYRSAVQFYNQNFAFIDGEVRGAPSVLDVGCGTGRLLEVLSKYRGLERVGIELNAARAAMARRIASCEVVEQPIEAFRFPQRFAVITMIDVLSHIPDLDSLFAALRSLLLPDGKLVLKVGECKGDVKKTALYSWDIPDHLHFLGMDSLAFICRKYAWKVLRHDRIPIRKQLFSPERWRSPGRSGARDAVKSAVAATSFALPALSGIYRLIHGESVYSSFIVLRPE